MTKLGKIFLVIVLVLITAAAGVFGYFFFSGKDYYDYAGATEDQKLTRVEAKALLTRALTDFSNIDKTETDSLAQTLSVDYSDQYEDYESERFIDIYPKTTFKILLQIATSLLSNQDCKENTNYLCTYKGLDFDLNDSSSMNQQALLSYSTKEDGVIIEFNVPTEAFYDYRPYYYDTNYVLKVSKGAEGVDSWTLEGFGERVEYGNRTCGEYLKIYAKDCYIYRMVSVSYSETNVDYMWSADMIYDHNRETREMFYETPENMEQHIKMVDKQLKDATFKDWEDWNSESFITCDFAEMF